MQLLLILLNNFIYICIYIYIYIYLFRCYYKLNIVNYHFYLYKNFIIIYYFCIHILCRILADILSLILDHRYGGNQLCPVDRCINWKCTIIDPLEVIIAKGERCSTYTTSGNQEIFAKKWLRGIK